MPAKKTRKRPSLKATAEKLTAIAERRLATMPEEAQEARVTAFARVNFTASRETPAKPVSNSRTRGFRASGRGRG
jgi:hypothetical protein